MKKYYVRKSGGSVFGPYSGDQLKKYAADGRLRPSDALSEDQKKWSRAGDVPGLDFEEEELPFEASVDTPPAPPAPPAPVQPAATQVVHHHYQQEPVVSPASLAERRRALKSSIFYLQLSFVIWFFLQLGGVLVMNAGGESLQGVGFLIVVSSIPFSIWNYITAVVTAAYSSGTGIAILTAILAAIPIVGLIVVLVLLLTAKPKLRAVAV